MHLILLSVASAVGIGLLLEPLFNDNDSSENNENSENTQQNTTSTVLLQNAGVAENAINGNENGNSLRGTLGADVINGFGGDDRIQSGSGDDTFQQALATTQPLHHMETMSSIWAQGMTNITP